MAEVKVIVSKRIDLASVRRVEKALAEDIEELDDNGEQHQ
jgi:hypothetical protein